MSKPTPIVRQLRLPGQAAAPDGPVDMTGMFAMHFAFRRDLDRFVAAVRDTPIGDRVTWRALQRRWDLFCHVLHDHHVAEDQGLWPELVRRADAAGDATARAVLDAMAAEHDEIDPLLESIADGFEQVTAAVQADARAALEVRMVAARERLGHHLGHEERDALALVQRYLSPADWEHFEKTYVTPAKSLRETLEVVGWLLHEMPSPAVARLMHKAKPLVVVWRAFLRGPFARRERRAFRYAVPAAVH
jgi:hypothetical protein